MSLTLMSGEKTSSEANCPYLYTRVKAMKGSLLPSSDLKSMEEYTSQMEVIDHLLETDYADYIREGISNKRGLEGLEEGINSFFYSQMNKLLGLLDESAPAYADIFCNEWDLYNLKTLIRNIKTKNDPEFISMSLIPVGRCYKEMSLKNSVIDNIESLVDLFERCSISQEKSLKEAISDYQKDHDVAKLEWLLESYYFQNIFKWIDAYYPSEDAEILHSLITVSIDLANFKVVLRFLGSSIDSKVAHTLFFPRGSLSFRRFESLLNCTQFDQVIELLHKPALVDVLEKGMLHYINSGDSSIFERRFEEYELRYKKHIYLRHPLSIAVLFYYAALAKNQLINLRMIARGIFYQLPRGAMREDLIYV